MWKYDEYVNLLYVIMELYIMFWEFADMVTVSHVEYGQNKVNQSEKL